MYDRLAANRRAREYRARHPIRTRLSYWRWKTGLPISEEDYVEMLAQGCALKGVGACFNPADRELSLDHDHETGRIRGILCARHNQAIAAIGDGHIEELERVVQYLGRE